MDHRKDKKKATKPRKPAAPGGGKTKPTPKKPTLKPPKTKAQVEATPEAQRMLDEAWERFKASEFTKWQAFQKEIGILPINETRIGYPPNAKIQP